MKTWTCIAEAHQLVAHSAKWKKSHTIDWPKCKLCLQMNGIKATHLYYFTFARYRWWFCANTTHKPIKWICQMSHLHVCVFFAVFFLLSLSSLLNDCSGATPFRRLQFIQLVPKIAQRKFFRAIRIAAVHWRCWRLFAKKPERSRCTRERFKRNNNIHTKTQDTYYNINIFVSWSNVIENFSLHACSTNNNNNLYTMWITHTHTQTVFCFYAPFTERWN